MLTAVTLRNFKRFEAVTIELGDPVVFIGPNNSGKTTALQALALWDTGLKRWMEKRGGRAAPEKRPGVTINRRDLLSLPIPDANLLWKDLHVRDVRRVQGRQRTENIRIDILVDAVEAEGSWQCGLEFDYANDQSFYCRPLRTDLTHRMPVPDAAANIKIAFLPPMSGLTGTETRLDPGAINVRLGEGRTAEVLRNLCYRILQEDRGRWANIVDTIRNLFGVTLQDPIYIPERGEITMSYKDPSGTSLDLSAAGRGLQQTLLLLSHLAGNPGSVLLLDEPDAHLEILRQRQIYQLLTEAATESRSQIIAASHSEVILNEAADRDVVVAFVGKPHRIDDRGNQVLKALKSIGFDQYYQADTTGWVLYLEGATDLAILKAFADRLGNDLADPLRRPFVVYVQNQPSRVFEHFFGLREARADLVAFALFDQYGSAPPPREGVELYQWQRREIENYLCTEPTLLAWAIAEGERQGGGPLIGEEWRVTMAKAIDEVATAMQTLGRGTPWDRSARVSEDFLGPLFERFFSELSLPNLMRKSDFHRLAPFVPREELDAEVSDVLERIRSVAERAAPNGSF
jgi:ABC-type taurine transport system ATPase subunit